MVTQQQFKDHYKSLYNSGAIYVWGANGETITKDLTDRLYKSYGSSTYNKTYYNNKFKEGKGKIGADCSGSIYPLSKKDNTARGYYNTCKTKGSINNLPANTACLIFNANFTHVGAYMGDGTTIEMMSSQKNCVKQNLQKSRWAYYGIPDWLETSSSQSNTVPTIIVSVKNPVILNIQKWCNSYCNAGLKEDGEFGPKTKQGLCKALQHCLNVNYKAGLDEDGSFGAKTKAACKSASNNKDLAYICQAMLYCKGYDMTHSIKNNNLDGSYGGGTKATVLLYQQNTRGLKHDGKCGPATFYAMFNS
jgi:hypothetical protein